jgi:hypothetical protein
MTLSDSNPILDPIFIAYAHEDIERAEEIRKSLESLGLTCFLDRHEIPPGATIDERIRRAIKECWALVVVLSENSLRSSYVANEVGWADQAQKPVVPFLACSNVVIPGWIGMNRRCAHTVSEVTQWAISEVRRWAEEVRHPKARDTYVKFCLFGKHQPYLAFEVRGRDPEQARIVAATEGAHSLYGFRPDATELLGRGGGFLLSVLKDWMEEEHFRRFEADQANMWHKVVHRQPIYARVPMTFVRGPNAGKTYVPVAVAYSIDTDTDCDYFLIFYIETARILPQPE